MLHENASRFYGPRFQAAGAPRTRVGAHLPA
jgi:hypothetical protein